VIDVCRNNYYLVVWVDLLRCFLCVDEVAAYEKRVSERELAGEKS